MSEAARWQEGPSPVLVCGWSALNGLALDAQQTWAFRRAELSCFVGGPFRCDNGARATMASLRALPPMASGVERIVPVARSVLTALGARLGALPPGTRAAAVLCLGERFDERGPRRFRWQRSVIEREVAAQLAAFSDAEVSWVQVVFAEGHASFGRGVVEACAALESGRVEAAVVCGVDTWHDPAVIEELIAARRLYDGENLDAMIPGEGGAAVLLAGAEVARRARWRPGARVLGAAAVHEPAHRGGEFACAGLGLTRACDAATRALRDAGGALDLWVTDMSAEQERVSEFQLAWPRVAAGLMKPEGTVEFTYNALGDLGAASMPTGAVVALESMRRGDPRATTALVSGSSDGPTRGAVLFGATR